MPGAQPPDSRVAYGLYVRHYLYYCVYFIGVLGSHILIPVTGNFLFIVMYSSCEYVCARFVYQFELVSISVRGSVDTELLWCSETCYSRAD